MRIAIVSDVHSNLEALDAVLRHADASGGLDEVWCLGDIVGYGADPAGVIAALRDRDAVAVAGNHDRAACGLLSLDEFNPYAAAAVRWTSEQLARGDIDYLSSLPLTRTSGEFTLVHGSLRSPEWEYLLEPDQAEAHFALQTTRYSAIGHSHLVFHVEECAPRALFAAHRDGDMVALGEERLILNPGSVGQPRDADARASYILYDRDAAFVTFRRVEYDIRATQRKMCDAGLDQWLIDRLAVGR
jgi:diadenosine tetraphosphatase ApaH/serine/threonine PP2A family protein phosphatase